MLKYHFNKVAKKVLILQFLLIQFYTVYEKYFIDYIMHVLIWNIDGKYTFCLATLVAREIEVYHPLVIQLYLYR